MKSYHHRRHEKAPSRRPSLTPRTRPLCLLRSLKDHQSPNPLRMLQSSTSSQRQAAWPLLIVDLESTEASTSTA